MSRHKVCPHCRAVNETSAKNCAQCSRDISMRDPLQGPEGEERESPPEETITLASSEGRTVSVRNGDVVGRTAVGREVLEVHEEVSRHHAQFVLSAGAWFIVDLCSSNGTFLEGERIPPQQRIRIRNGQRVMLSPVFQAALQIRESPEEESRPASEHAEAGGRDSSRKTVVILFADLKGSVDFFQERGTIVARNWIMKLYRMLSLIINRRRGMHIKNIGDAILAAFDDPHEAAKAAVEMQADLRAHNRTADEAGQYLLRIGMNMGPVLFEDHDIFGNAVNIASRVQALAPPERIFITARLYEAIREDRDVQCCFVGLEQLKGVKEKTGIYEILCGDKRETYDAQKSREGAS